MYLRRCERETPTKQGIFTRDKMASKMPTFGRIYVWNIKITQNILLIFTSMLENNIFELYTKFQHQMLRFDIVIGFTTFSW